MYTYVCVLYINIIHGNIWLLSLVKVTLTITKFLKCMFFFLQHAIATRTTGWCTMNMSVRQSAKWRCV